MLIAAALALAVVPAAAVSEAWADDVVFEKRFGGNSTDFFKSVAEVPGGVVAVGWADEGSFGDGDWEGFRGNGGKDAIVVMYDDDGNLLWKRNFGGQGDDMFHSVAAVPGGIVAVGASESKSFGTGDWRGVTGKGGADAIAVKFDDAGNAVWRRSFGGAGADVFHSVAAVPGGVVAAGLSDIPFSFFEKEPDIKWSGYGVAVVARLDDAGNLVWDRSFPEGAGYSFLSVAAMPGGLALLGDGPTDEEGSKHFVAKYDDSGALEWWRGIGGGEYHSLTASSDGIFAVGAVGALYFGKGFWEGVKASSEISDAVILKMDAHGDVVWKGNYGGLAGSTKLSYVYCSVTAAPDGVMAAGYVTAARGTGISYQHAFAVKYSGAGEAQWDDVNSASFFSLFTGVVATSDGFIVAGGSGTTPWSGGHFTRGYEALIVRYGTVGVVPVEDITGVPNRAAAGTPLALRGAVAPSNATWDGISWSVKDAGDTGAAISGGMLYTTGTGTAVVTATVENDGFSKDFAISVGHADAIGLKEGGPGAGMWLYAGLAAVLLALCAIAAAVLIGKGARRAPSGSSGAC